MSHRAEQSDRTLSSPQRLLVVIVLGFIAFPGTLTALVSGGVYLWHETPVELTVTVHWPLIGVTAAFLTFTAVAGLTLVVLHINRT